MDPGKELEPGAPQDGGGCACPLQPPPAKRGSAGEEEAKLFGKGLAGASLLQIAIRNGIYQSQAAHAHSGTGKRRPRHRRNLSLGAPPTSGSSASRGASPLSTLSLDRKTFLRHKQSKQLQPADRSWVRADLRRGCIHVHDWLTPSHPRPVLLTSDTTAGEVSRRLEGSKAGAVLRINFTSPDSGAGEEPCGPSSASSSEVCLNDLRFGACSGSDLESSTCEDLSSGGPTEQRGSLTEAPGLGSDSSAAASPTCDSANEGPDPFESSSDEVDLTSDPPESGTGPAAKSPGSSQARPLTDHGPVQPDPGPPGPPGESDGWTEAAPASPTPDLFIQLHGGPVRRLGSEERPLQMLTEYLANLGYQDPWRVQEEAMNPEIGCLIRFYFGKPRSVGGAAQLSGVFNVRKGKLALPVTRWSKRQVTLSGTCLIVSSVKHTHAGKVHVLPMVGGKVEQVRRHGHCLALTAPAPQSHTYYVSFHSYTELLRWLRCASQVASQRVSSVDLSCCSLEELPAQLFYSQDLTHLSLKSNFLSLQRGVPALSRFSRLRTLSLASNGLLRFPLALCDLASLSELDLSGNRLQALPARLGLMSSLQTLLLDGNLLQALPAQLEALETLAQLGLTFNRFAAVPPVLEKLHSLERLSLAGNLLSRLDLAALQRLAAPHVDLRLNQLQAVTPGDPQRLVHIARLDLRDAGLRQLDVRSLTRLELLRCDRNFLWALWVSGRALRSLHAAHNELQQLEVQDPPGEPGAAGPVLEPAEPRAGLGRSLRPPGAAGPQPQPREPPAGWAVVRRDSEDAAGRVEPAAGAGPGRRPLGAGGPGASAQPAEGASSGPVPAGAQVRGRPPRQEPLAPSSPPSASSLRLLNVSANWLESLPAGGRPEESASSGLEELRLSGNLLTEGCLHALSAHAGLRLLHLAFNRLQSFGASCFVLPHHLFSSSSRSFPPFQFFFFFGGGGAPPQSSCLFLPLFLSLLLSHFHSLFPSHFLLPCCSTPTPPPETCSTAHVTAPLLSCSLLGRLDQLEELDLSGNRLRMLPSSLLSCRQLHTLAAHSNCLATFPEVLQLPEIKCVDLSCNQLSAVSLPESLPAALLELDLSGNPRLQLDHKALELLNNIRCFRVDPSPAAPGAWESRGAPAVWSHGFTEASGPKNRSCVAALALDSFGGTGQCLYGVFDGERNTEVPTLLQCTMGDVLAEELQREPRHDDYMSHTFLTMQRKLGTAGQRLGGSAALCHISHQPAAPGEPGGCFTLRAANVGRCRAALCRAGAAVEVSRVLTVGDEDELRRVRRHRAVVTEDNKVGGVSDATRIMGFSFLCPAVSPRPHVSAVTLSPQDEFLLVGSRGLWEALSPQEAVDAVRDVPDALAAAKKLVTLAQSSGCGLSLSAVVVRLSVTEEPPPSPGPAQGPPHSPPAEGLSAAASEPSSEFSASEMSSEVGSTASSEDPLPQAGKRAGAGGGFQRQFSGALSDNGLDSEDEEPIAGVFSNGSRVEVEADVHCRGHAPSPAPRGESRPGAAGRRARANGSVARQGRGQDLIEEAADAPARRPGAYFNAPAQPDPDDQLIIPPELEDEVRLIIQQQSQQSQQSQGFTKPAHLFLTPL
ncbi:LOW QUALITY PROTEIN: PH domain leucine-rich repeat-containing protein phosphatase 1-like [Synchiropus picturatus]